MSLQLTLLCNKCHHPITEFQAPREQLFHQKCPSLPLNSSSRSLESRVTLLNVQEKESSCSLRLKSLGFSEEVIREAISYFPSYSPKKLRIVCACIENGLKPISEDFIELTYRMKSWKETICKLATLQNVDSALEALKTAYENHEWEKLPQNYPYYALEGVRQGKISVTQFATIMSYWSAVQLYGEVESVSNKRKVKEALMRSSKITKDEKSFPTLSPEQVDTLVDNLSPSEQFIFFPKTRILGVKTIAYRVYLLGITPLTVIKQTLLGFHLSAFEEMIPSAEMIERYISVVHGERRVKPNWVLGLSTPKEISEGLKKDVRDVALHFPGEELPSDADGCSAPFYDFTRHDLYHLNLVSSIEKKYRKELIQVGEQLRTLDKDSPLFKISDDIVDLEIIDFVFYHLHPSHWGQLEEAITTQWLLRNIYFHFDELSSEERRGYMEKLLKIIQEKAPEFFKCLECNRESTPVSLKKNQIKEEFIQVLSSLRVEMGEKEFMLE